jgi:hypothetical protein
MIISHIKHSVEDVLAQEEEHPHSQSIQKMSPFNTSSLLQAMGQRLCKAVFVSKRCGGENALILICEDGHESSP